MLGWALKKGIQSATGVKDAPVEDGDTTQIEAPDTPAPVFAARAIQRAIFGTPALPKESSVRPPPDAADNKTEDALLKDSRSPSKPTGILLTPGTATARRKRVSFDHDVKAGTNGEPNSLATKSKGASARSKSFQQRLEESRSNKTKKVPPNVDGEVKENKAPETGQPPCTEDTSDEEWEDDVCSHDVTVDLNEPHSRSGKYWKSEFTKYTGDARAEMEKLVKYKHLAKVYAQKKDAEAVDLNQKLKEEHDKVKKLETKIAELASQGTSKERRGSDSEAAPAKKLAQYKARVKELESLLQDSDNPDGHLHRYRLDTSPRTEKTLLETSRELRRAKTELKEMKRLRDQNERLKSDLLFAEQRAAKLVESSRIAGGSSQASWTQALEKQLQEAKLKAAQKDDELEKLRKEFNTLKDNAKSSRSQAMQVLKEKNDKIAELEKELKNMREAKAFSSRPRSLDAALAQHKKIAQDMKMDIASMTKPPIHERAGLERLKRSISAEDLTFDVTQSLFVDSPSQKPLGRRSAADVTNSLRDMERQLRTERQERLEARRRNRGLVTDASHAPFTDNLEHDKELDTAQSSRGHRRAMSQKTNEASANTRQRDLNARATASHSDRGIMRDALDNLTNSRYTARSYAARPPSPKFDAQGFDLLQNRFAKLGGPNANDTILTANVSRCTLPAERQAAARARLDQKRRERQRVNDKENVRP